MEIRECPQCGAAASPSSKKCEYCKAEFFITSIAYLSGFDSSGIQKYMQHYKALTKANPEDTEGQLGLGLCYLQLGIFPLAQKAFENVISDSPAVAQAYYYRCLSVIAGRRVMTMNLKEIRDVESYLNTAIQIDDNAPHFRILLSIIKHDYYLTNGMKVPAPTHTELLAQVQGKEVNTPEIERLKQSLKVPDFSVFNI